MASGVLAQLKVLIGADISRLKSGLNEAQVASEKSSRKIEHNFHHLGTVFERLIGPLSATGREISVAMDAIGASAAEANKSMESMGTAFAVTATVGTAAFAALAGITLKLFDGLEETAHAAAGVGMGVAQYTELTEALKVFDINQEQANQALAYFDKILSGLVRSKAGYTAIKELGLNMAKLRAMSPHDALLAIADAFSKLKDGTMKAGIAAALFENTYGIKLIPFLNQGRAGIEELESKYHGLASATADNAGAAENLDESWSALKANLEGLTLEISHGIGVPVMLEAIAHPLLMLKTILMGFASLVAKVFEDMLSGIEKIIPELDVALATVHLPTLSLAGVDKARQYFHNLSAGFAQMGGKFAEQIVSPAEHGPGGGGIHSGSGHGGGNGPNKAAAYLSQLHEQLADFNKGDAAKGLERLKALGATQAQLAQGKGLLAAIQALKDEKAFAQEFERSQKSMGKLLDKLKVPTEQVKGLASAFADLADKIRETGAAPLGIKMNPGASIQSQALAAAGVGTGPIGGNVGVFTPAGLGKMRFDFEKLNQSAEKWGKTMSESFTRMIENGQGFRQMLDNLLHEFETFIIKATLFKELGSSLSGQGGFLGSVGSFFTGLALPGRASGGPVTAGSLYMVGEQGPELFAPAMSGSILPNSALGGGKGGNTYIDARGADAGVEHRVRRALKAAQKQAVGQSLVAAYEYQARGGKM